LGKDQIEDLNLGVSKDQFLEVLLGRPAYLIGPNCKLSSKSLGEGEHSFLYAKISSDQVEALERFQSLGFRVVDLNLQLERRTSRVAPTTSFSSHSDRITVGWAQASHRVEVREMARSSFLLSRFHLDPKMENAVADQIKATWAENFFQGKRGDRMIVSTIENEVVGFILIIEGDDFACLDLVAVSIDHRRKGIVTIMIEFALKGLGHKDKFIVGTQISNIPSIRAYEKLGFSTFSTSYVLHYHGSFNPSLRS
jgi:ribosomal protein S18 acetylase RimI-like enzyme